MVNLKIIILFSTVFLFSCNSDKSKPSKVESNLTWPKNQDSIGSIFEHYERVVPLNMETDEVRYSVVSDGSWGVVDEENRLYFPFEYDSIISNKSSIALKKFSNYEIFDADRNLLGSVQSDDLQSLLNGFYVSERSNRKTLVNPNGMLVVDHRFQDLSVPPNAAYFLGKANGSWHAFDLAGSPIDSNFRASEAARWLDEYKVLLKSYGPLKIGMNKEELEKAIGWPLQVLDSTENCYTYSAGDDFLNFTLTLTAEKGATASLERIDFFASGIMSKSGVGVGSKAIEVIKVYGDKIERVKAGDEEQIENLFYVPTDRRDKAYRLKFLSRYGRISSYSIGRLPSIGLAAGCS
jgi:hypothetical protein